MSLFVRYVPTALGGGGGGGGVTLVGAIDSQTPSADGAVIIGNTLYMQSASLTVPGLVNLTTQSFLGQKTFSTGLTGTLTGHATLDVAASSLGNLTDAGTDGIVVTGGTGAVVGTVSLAQHVADTTHNGYLSATDWNTFNGKQGAGNYITALTGDGTASGPGSAALTLATVNGNVGSFGSATQVTTLTANAKGLITAAASVSIQIAESQVTNLVSDLAGKQATVSIGTFSASSTANGLDITSAILTLHAADGTNPGALTAAAQAVGGVKTFASAPVMTALTASQVVVTDSGKALASVPYSTTPAASTIAEWDASANLSADNFIEGYTTTATAAGTTTLVVGDKQQQFFTGATTQTVVLPVTSTLVLGFSYTITNLSSGVVTVQSSGANTIQAMAANSQLVVTCILVTGTGTASWSWAYSPVVNSGLPLTNPMTTGGDIIYGGASGVPTRLANGAAGQFPVSAGGTSAPAWGWSSTILAKTGNYTLVNSDNTVSWDVSGGSATATLPTAVGIGGKVFTILDSVPHSDTVSLSIATTSAQTIGTRASSNIVLAAYGDWIQVQSDGSNWIILGKQETRIMFASNQVGVQTGGKFVTSATSVTLGIGTWRVRAYFYINNGTGTSVTIGVTSGLYGADGANSVSTPTVTVANGQGNFKAVYGEPTGANYATTYLLNSIGAANSRFPAGFIEATTTVGGGTQAIYAVANTDASVAGSATVATYVRAERIF